MIEGVLAKPLDVFPDERGFVMEVLSSEEPIFERFGQVYVTACRRGFAKAWHYHREQVDYFACVAGRALVVVCDLREGSPTRGETQEFVLESPAPAAGAPILVRVPALVVHGLTALDCEEARVLNVSNRPYRREAPDKVRLAWNSPEVPYRWPNHVRDGG